MKQKQLLIAFGALVLAACGGSIDLGPRVAAPPIQPERSPDPLVYPIYLTPERNWYTNANYADADDVAPDVVFIEDGIEIYTTSPNQQLVTRIPGALNLSEATMVFTVSADRDYLSTTEGVQPLQRVFNNGEEDSVEDGDNWGCWTWIGDWEPDTPTEIECNVPAAEAFDLEADQYALIGIQSVGDDVQGFLRLHDVFIEYYPLGRPGEPVSYGSLTITSLTIDDEEYSVTEEGGSWVIHDDGDASLEYSDDGVVISPAFSGDYPPKLVYMVAGPVNLEGASFQVEFTVDQTFIDSELTVEAIAQQNFGSYTAEACEVVVDAADSKIVATCEDLSDAISAGASEQLRIGLQINNE